MSEYNPHKDPDLDEIHGQDPGHDDEPDEPGDVVQVRALDPEAVARQVKRILADLNRRTGEEPDDGS